MTIFAAIAGGRWQRIIVAGAIALTPAVPVQATGMPAKIAGIAIPRTELARRAEDYVRGIEPAFLFNHSVRTFVFGAIRANARAVSFDPEIAYVAALFHDLGLVPAMASPGRSFEVDSATHAEDFVKANGGSAEQGRLVWNAIVTHDMGFAYASHQSTAAIVVAAGAGADVDGIDPKLIQSATVAEVLSAVPRLQFKKSFTATVIDHCRRKPTSQIGWLDGLCREVEPNADRGGSVEKEIASAPYSE